MCVHTCVYISMKYVCLHTHAHMTYACLRMCMYIDIQCHMLLNMYRYMCPCICIYIVIHSCLYICIYIDIYIKYTHAAAGWQTPIGCLKLQVMFRNKVTNHRAFLRKTTCRDKASYGSSPPCINALNTRTHTLYTYSWTPTHILQTHTLSVDIYTHTSVHTCIYTYICAYTYAYA